MTTEPMTAEDIERAYADFLRKPFPYQDCSWLRSQAAWNSEDLIPDLDHYFSDVAGFASSATRLNKREREQLEKYRPYLKLNFFQRFPNHLRFRDLIDLSNTPTLHTRLSTTERIRISLIPLMDEAIKRKQNRRAQRPRKNSGASKQL